MRRFPHRYLAGIGLLVGLLVLGGGAHADDRTQVVTGVFCDTEVQIEGFAEAHFGAQLSVGEATRAINEAAGRDDACSPISNVIVRSMEEVKEVTIGGNGYAITRLTVLGVMVPTPGGMQPRLLPAMEPYVLARSKLQRVQLYGVGPTAV